MGVNTMIPPAQRNGMNPAKRTNETVDVPPDVQRVLLEQEMQTWKNTRYQAELRLRVARRIGDGAEVEVGLVKQMERCEQALDVLVGLLAEIDHPQ